MNRKITFHEMDHSKLMKEHINKKLNRIEELVKDPIWATPKYVEFFLNSHPQHPHHKVELILKTPQFDLCTHAEGVEMYAVVDSAIDKMVTLLKKDKQKLQDKRQKVETAKNKFDDDKYNL